MKPIIQFAVGQAVKELQILLNKIQSALGRISEDGAFGPKNPAAGNRVTALPRAHATTASWDRERGPQSDGLPAAGIAPPPDGTPVNEAAARDRIVQFALQNYQQYGGWKQGADRPSPTGLNHHFVVAGVDDSGISEIKQRQGYFLSPVWEMAPA
ncbi:MAG: hypothetical protein LC126_25055 [Bryobacterales bacterium]|nr:hypothetical protein [Bryobacterales bacterium]